MKKLYLLILLMLTVFSVLNAQPNSHLNSTSSAAISSLTLSGVTFPDKSDQIQNSVHSLVNEPGNVAEDIIVTFQVDVKNEFVSNDSVLMIASWNDWAPMMMTGNGTVYSISASLPVGTEQQYKFIKGLNDWESISDPSCTAEGNDNRLLIVPDNDTTLPVVCYGECVTCISWYAPQITIRQVQGEGDVTPYLDQDIKTEGVITAINQYGAYIQDTSDFRSGLFVYEPNLIYQYSRGQSVHFIATAAEYNGLTGILGVQFSAFAEKEYAVIPLNIQITDIGEETEGVLTTLSNVEVLYLDDFSQYVVRNESGDTAIISNYFFQPFLEIGSSYNLTGVVDYRHNKYMLEPRDRDDLQNLTHPPVEVTFRVDMQNETVSPNGVHLNGSFVNWSEEIEMNLVTEQIYSVTLTLAVGETFTYKFVNGGTFEWEYYEIPPEKCTTGENNDREITVPETNLVLDIVCFNSCYNCDKPDELNISINETLDPPVIDGLPDNIWDKVNAVPIERDFLGESPTVTASWKAMYDDDNIYVLVEVEDDDHYPAWEAGSENHWEYDQAELFFDVNNLLLDGFGPSAGGSGHWVFSEAMLDGGYGNPQVGYSLAAPVSWCYTLSGQNYTVEYAFPFNSLTQNDGTILDVNDFKNLGAFGFDVTIDDRDVTKDSRNRKVWQNIGIQDEAYNNMDDCGTISLNGETIAEDNTLKNDSLALVALYNATDGANWTNNENWLTGPVSTWFGITMENNRVTDIVLQSNNLNGNLPAEIGDLTALRTLDFRLNNGLSDSFPIEICQLLNLEYIDFYQCRFYGAIPAEIGNLVNLTYLQLGINYGLSGSIPAELGNLTNLQYLFLQGNQLVGTIPTGIASLDNLVYLFLYGNQLSGSIPDFDQLPNLTRAYLFNNYFDELPDITRPSGLADFSVRDNKLTFEDLEYNMDLTDNTNFEFWSMKPFGDPVDVSLNLGDSYNLTVSCGGTQNIYQWYLNDQPYSYSSSSPDFLLENVDYNYEGAWVCRVSNTLVPGLVLESEPLSVNMLGPCNVQDSLALVDLYNATDGDNWLDNENWLTGPVYTWHGIEMQAGRVIEIWLGQNNLSDSLPASLGQLSSLEILGLGGNGLGGSIPEELGSLDSLRYLWLWSNQLTGTIPASLGQLSNLNILSLNGNNLTGNIPPELGLCNDLWVINLDWNFLDGEIPVELCNISSLSSVNFASNNFDENSCAAITCLLSNGVSFIDSPDQLQRNGYSLTNDCGTVVDSTWVTFRVNMQNEIINPNGIHINGSFSDWQQAVEMQLDSLSYYSASILIPAGQTITYKFVNGGREEWEFYEIPPGYCTVGDNNDRELYVPHSGETLVLDVVCFAGCTNCGDNSIQQYTLHEIQGDGDVSPLNGQAVRTKGRITGINEFGFFMQDATGARNGIFVYDPALAAQLFQGAHIELIATVSEYNGRTQLSGTQWFDYTDDSFELYIAEIEVSDIGEDYEGVFIALNNVRVLSQNEFQEYIAVSPQGDTTVIDNYLIQPVMEIGSSYTVYGIVDNQNGTFRVNPRAEGGIIRLGNNIGVAGLISPSHNQNSNYLYCGLSGDEPITVRIYNNGDLPIENAVIGYSVDELTISLDTLDFILQPGDTIDYTFNNGANFYHSILVRNYQLNIFMENEDDDLSDNTFLQNMNVDGDYQDVPYWTTYNSCDGMLSDVSFGIAEDGDGNIWSTSFYGADRFDGSEWNTFTVNEGLSENYSWAIEHDNDGNIWFAGTDSLVITRFNGQDFTYYPQPAKFEECIYNDSQGNMWFGSWNAGGVARFDGQNWTYFMNDAVDFGYNIYSIAEDANGNILVSCFTSEGPKIKMYNGDAWFDFNIPENNDLVSEIFFDSNQNTWFTTETAYYKFDGSDWDVYDSSNGILDNLCQDISEDIYGNIWFGGGREIVKYNGTSWKKYTAEDGMAPTGIGNIYALFADSDGNIWIGTYRGGISKFAYSSIHNLKVLSLTAPEILQPANSLCNPRPGETVTVSLVNAGSMPIDQIEIGYRINNDTIVVENPEINLSSDDTTEYTFTVNADLSTLDYLKDIEFEVFVLTQDDNPDDNQLIKNFRIFGDYTDVENWTTYNSCDGMMSDISFALAEDKNGDIWSTDFFGASKFDGQSWSTYTVEDGLGENYHWAIENDSEGNIWFAGTNDTAIITKFDGTNFIHYPQSTKFDECIYSDSQGNIWFGSWNAYGVAMFDGVDWTYFMNNEINFGIYILSIGEDANGNILVSVYEGEGNGRILKYDGSTWSDFEIPNNTAYVSEIYFDSKGNTWFATNGKYFKYDGVNWLEYTIADGILSSRCQDISEDINGNLWFGGGTELVKFDGISWTKYTADDGMVSVTGGIIYAVLADSQGDIWVGTNTGGISKFDNPLDEICTTLHFQTGWNLFSTPVILEPDSVGFNFQSLVDNASLVKIQDELGNAFEDPGIFGDWDDSQIKPLRPYDGFKINVSRGDSVQFCGRPVSYPYPIYLYEGWNIMGYPQTTAVDAEEIIQDLIDKGSLLKVQDEAGSSIEDLGVFGGWTNFMGNMVSGEGYKIKVSANDTLWIYETYPKSTLVERPKVQPLHFAAGYSGNGVDHMNLNVVDLPIQMLGVGDELAVYDGAVCVGAVTLLPENMESRVVSIAVSAADKYGMPGFGEGNAYTLRLWQQKTRIEQKLDPDILKGPAVFAKHESAILSLKNFSDIEEGMMKNMGLKCYPNPFSTELIIEAGLADAAEVDVQIINQLGQQVNYLVNKQGVSAGIHRWTWNGDNGSGQKVEPGIYYIRLSADDKIVVNKVVLTK